MFQFYAVHDPMGMMSPLTIKYKLQKLSNQAGWDNLVEDKLADTARKILKEVRDINFPRLVKPECFQDWSWYAGGTEVTQLLHAVSIGGTTWRRSRRKATPTP